MVKRGHEVTVLTGIPNYPEGIIYEGYRKGQKRDEVINGVRVIRCFTIGRRTGAIFRFLNYYSYAISSSLKILLDRIQSSTGMEFDVVFVNQLSPVMMTYAGIKYKKRHNKKLILYCLDLWPESLVAGGISRDSFVFTIFDRTSRKIYRACDHILVTSRMFTDYLSEHFGIEKANISYLPQYAESLFSEIPQHPEDKETIDFVFAGNIGEIQSVQTIIEAAEILKSDRRIRFHIVGGGTDLERLQNLVKEKSLENVIFYGRRPVEEMPKYYALADAMLITLAPDPILSMTLPGKVQSYMAAGKPIIGAINGETTNVVQDADCGFVGPASNAEELARNIQKFIGFDSLNRIRLSENARSYYKEHFLMSFYMDSIEKTLNNAHIND